MRFYVTLPHDSQYIRLNDLRQQPITVTATVHGGKGPFTYTWYNLNNGDPLVSGVGSSSYTDYFNFSNNYYNVSRIAVIVENAAGDSSVTDYMDIYKICDQPRYFSPDRVSNNDSTTFISCSVKVFPNPNTGQFTVRVISTDGSAKYIEIYSMMGEEVFKEPLLIPSGDNVISFNNQANGVYFYRVLTEKGKLIGCGKLIIEK